jgi:septal ring factor EnvC (AmiA/AmiB activator)
LPATQDDVRSLRRWLIVVAVWAVAASAIGIIALVASDDNSSKTSSATDARIARLEHELSMRIQSLQTNTSKAASAEDVAKLDARIKSLRKDLTDATDASKSTTKDIDDLKTRVDELEKRVDDVEKNRQAQGP